MTLLIPKRNWIVLTIVGILLHQAKPIPAQPHRNRSKLDTEVVAKFGFERENWDRNYDDWPDDWVRKTGSGYPAYLDIEIVQRTDGVKPHDQCCLHIRRDGGAAEIKCPPLKINPNHSYALEGWVKTAETDRNEQNDAWLSLSFFSSATGTRESIETKKLRQVGDWTLVRVGPIAPTDQAFDRLEVGVHFAPSRPEDLYGEAWFDNLKLTYLPRLNATTNYPFNVIPQDAEIDVSINVSGLKTDEASLRLELFGVDDSPVYQEDVKLSVPKQPAGTEDDPEEGGMEGTVHQLEDGSFVKRIQLGPDVYLQRGVEDTIVWTPPIQQPGYYRAEVELATQEGPNMSRSLPLVVLRHFNPQSTAPFGWNLRRQPASMSLQNLVTLLSDAGVHWVAYPVWYGKEDEEQGQRIGELAERLTLAEMELVAVLDEPPPSVQHEFSRVDRGIAAVLRDAEVWHPAIDHVMTRLSFKINWWQLGSFDDMSFVGNPLVEVKIREIREHLMRFGKNIHLGLTWNWLYDYEATPDSGWDYLVRTTATKMTSQELDQHLDLVSERTQPIWATLQPLAADAYTENDRLVDLVERMIVAKIRKMDALFIKDPISSYDGLLNDDMTPTKLFLPWRTTAMLLAEAEYLGRLDLPNGSTNYMFEYDDKVMMVIWNKTETTEQVHLGYQVEVVDCWGQTISPADDSLRSEITAGPNPLFIIGIDPTLIHWQMACQFTDSHVASSIGRRQATEMTFQNTLDFGVAGTVTVYSEELWNEPITAKFKLNAGEIFHLPIEVNPHPNIITGPQPVRIDFVVAGHTRHEFSINRQLTIGIKDIRVDTSTQMQGNDLLVHATIINDSEDSNDTPEFTLYLFSPNRRRLRLQVGQLPPGRERLTFALKDGRELVGETIWLRVEEQTRAQALNYRLEVTDPMRATPNIPTE